MYRILTFLLTAFLVATTSVTHAFNVSFGDSLDIVQEIQGDVYGVAERIDASANIDGDFIIAGWDIHIDAEVSQDIMAAGWEIVISETVGDDVRLAGGSIRIEADILWDLIVFGGEVRVDDSAVIHGDVVIFAGAVVLNGNVLWDAYITSDRLILNGSITGDAQLDINEFTSPSWSGTIAWNLEYQHKEIITELEKVVTGEVLFTIHDGWDRDNEKEHFLHHLAWSMVQILWWFVVAGWLLCLFERFFSRAGNRILSAPGQSILIGLALVIWIPFLIILLMITVIWIPFGLFILFLYIFMFVFTPLFNVIVVSTLISEKYSITTTWKKYAILLWATTIFCLIGFLNVLVALFVLWAIALEKREVVRQMRK